MTLWTALQYIESFPCKAFLCSQNNTNGISCTSSVWLVITHFPLISSSQFTFGICSTQEQAQHLFLIGRLTELEHQMLKREGQMERGEKKYNKRGFYCSSLKQQLRKIYSYKLLCQICSAVNKSCSSRGGWPDDWVKARDSALNTLQR